jgi:hypothetical protein
MKPLRTLALVAAAGAMLAACGGGGTSYVALDEQVPESATSSSEAYTSYAQLQVQLDDVRPRETPLALDLIAMAPTSETADPVDFD